MVEAGRQGGFEAVGLLEQGGDGGDKQRSEGTHNLFGNLVQFGERRGGDGDIQTKLKEALCSFDELILKREGVFKFGLSPRVNNPTALEVCRSEERRVGK